MTEDYPIVLVEWVDASGRDGWQTKDDAFASNVHLGMRSVGFLLRETEDVILICETIPEIAHSSVQEWGTTHAIPRCAIKSLRRLRGR